jgi:predicted transcriptional regulator
MMSVTSVRISKELNLPLQELAEKQQRSKSWLINAALREYIAKQNTDQQKWQDTLEAIDSIGRGDVVESEDVHDWLKSWGTKDELDSPK